MIFVALAVAFPVIGVVWAGIAIRSRNWLQVAQIACSLPCIEAYSVGSALRLPWLVYVSVFFFFAGPVAYFLIGRRLQPTAGKVGD
jgi:hypothetical protein